MLRVAINAVFLDPPMGGVETYLVELCRHLVAGDDAPQLTLFVNPAGHARIAGEDWAGSVELVRCDVIGRAGARAVGELTALGPMADRRRADVVHSVAMTGPLLSRAARVVTVPDTIWITHPDDTLTHRLWRRVVPLVARRSHRVIAISHAAADDLRRDLGVPDAKLDVVPLGFGVPATATPTPASALRAALDLGDGPIVLNVGQKKPHRNLELLVRAMRLVRERVPDVRLVLPGLASAEAEAALRAAVAQAGVAEVVRLPGYVDAADLEGLYREASAFILPSLVEGFGLPVLEAMARALPVACSRSSAPAEVAGDAAVLFDPTSEREVAEATVALLTDPGLRERLITAGTARVQAFSWERMAKETLVVYRRAMNA